MPVAEWLNRFLLIARQHPILTAIAAFFLLWWGVPTASQVYYDGKVRSLCAIDGGLNVYERVKLPAEKFDGWGGIRIPIASDAKPTDDFVMEWETKRYHAARLMSDDISVRRDKFVVVRRSDGKVLGEAISYARRGGDPFGPWEQSSFRCPKSGDDQSLVRAIFIHE